MRPFVAALLVVGMSVGTVKASDDKPAAPPLKPSGVRPEKDVRIANLLGARPQKIGVLAYYPNKGGGYTFMEREHIVFYALPLMPATCQFDRIVRVVGSPKGEVTPRNIVERTNVSIIGTSKMPVGGQTIYRGEMHTYFNVYVRHDIAIAKWSRDTANGQFRLSTLSEDNETRLKLKSIVPVLEKNAR
jgi:hypothetical protein